MIKPHILRERLVSVHDILCQNDPFYCECCVRVSRFLTTWLRSGTRTIRASGFDRVSCPASTSADDSGTGSVTAKLHITRRESSSSPPSMTGREKRCLLRHRRPWRTLARPAELRRSIFSGRVVFGKGGRSLPLHQEKGGRSRLRWPDENRRRAGLFPHRKCFGIATVKLVENSRHDIPR